MYAHTPSRGRILSSLYNNMRKSKKRRYTRLSFSIPVLLACLVLPQSLYAQEAKFTDLQTFRAADPVESIGASVDFEAVTTYIAEHREFLFVQSGQNAIFVHKPCVSKDHSIEVGQRVRVRGQIAKGDLLPIISRSQVDFLGEGKLPVAETVANIGVEHDCRYLEFELNVAYCRVGFAKSFLYGTTDSKKDVYVEVMHASGYDPNPLTFAAGSRVRIPGVLGLKIDGPTFRKPGDSANQIAGYRIFCNSPDEIVTLNQGKLNQRDRRMATVCLGLGQTIDDDFQAGRFLTSGQICLVQDTQPPTLIASDGSTFVRFSLQTVDQLQPGMVMRIGGTKIQDRYGQTQYRIDYLRDLAMAELPKTETISVKQAVETLTLDQRISVEGRPSKIIDHDGKKLLILEEGDSRIAVEFQPAAIPARSAASPKHASLVRITGIAQTGSACDYKIVVARAEDAMLIKGKKFLSRSVAIGLGMLLAVCVLGGIWIRLLRNQVNQKQRFEQIFDNAGCPIIVFNGDLQIVDANEVAAGMTGYSKRELRSMNVSHIDPYMKRDVVKKMLADTMESQEVATFPTQVLCREGNQIDVEVHCRNLKRSDELRKATFIAVFPDTTTQKEHENSLKAARDEAVKANEAKSQFVAAMSHELRTPLNGVIGMLQLLERTQLTTAQAEYLATCRTSGETLLTVIGDVLDFSKLEAGKLQLESEQTELIPFIENLVRATNFQKGDDRIELASFVDPRLSRSVMVDSDRLQQVIFNLIGNAIKFTSEGCITVTARCRNVTNEHADLRITVADTGIGIPPDRIDCLFEAFEQCDSSTTRKYGGTGLGLTICKQIIDLMGGQIHVNSVEGVGSEFVVDVRLRFAEESETPETAFDVSGQRVAFLGMRPPIAKLFAETFDRYQVDATFLDETDPVPADAFDVVFFNSDGRVESAELLAVRQPELFSSKRPKLIPVVPANCLVATEKWKNAGVEHPVYKPLTQTHILRVFDPNFAPVETRAVEHIEMSRIGDNLRVLLCEDVPVNQMLVKEICRRSGIDCVVSENGKEAIETLQRDDSFDIIFMDCQMPIMDGFEATRRIRQMDQQQMLPKIPIIALTANASEDVRKKCLAAGMDDYLAKPFEICQFLDKVCAHTDSVKTEDTDTQSTFDQPSANKAAQTTDVIFNIEKFLGQLDDREFILDLAKQFTETFPEYQQDIEESVAAQNLQRAAEAAHRVKGAAGMVHAERISGVAKQMEAEAKSDSLEHVQTQLDEMIQEFEQFQNAYRQEVEQLATDR